MTGDADQFYWGAGTFASRGAVVAGNAINEAAKVVRKKILKLASEHFNAPEEELELADGMVRAQDLPRSPFRWVNSQAWRDAFVAQPDGREGRGQGGRDWMSREQGEGHEFLHEATQVKNIWAPTGE